VIIDSFTWLEPSRTIPSAESSRRAQQDDVAVGSWSTGTSSVRSPTTRIAVSGKKLGQRRERALSLRDRAHLDPVPEEHDRHERGELLPERHAGYPQRHHRAENDATEIARLISVIIPANAPSTHERSLNEDQPP